jgi:diguanylate cyclase (GGDEF)-like protein
VRREDKVTRYGGEELAVILPAAGADDACAIAERLRAAVASQPFKFAHATGDRTREVLILVTISAGVACLPEDARTGEALVEAADKALYEAKRAGRNRTVLHSSLRPDHHLRLVR